MGKSKKDSYTEMMEEVNEGLMAHAEDAYQERIATTLERIAAGFEKIVGYIEDDREREFAALAAAEKKLKEDMKKE